MVPLANSTCQLEIFLDLGLTFGTNFILISDVIALVALLNTMRSSYNLGYHPARHWNTEPSITSPQSIGEPLNSLRLCRHASFTFHSICLAPLNGKPVTGTLIPYNFMVILTFLGFGFQNSPQSNQ